MTTKSTSAGLVGLALLFTIPFLSAPDAQAQVLSRHIANSDTYVETFTPRPDNATTGAGYYIERQYDFGLERLTERFYGEQSMQIVRTPFSDFKDYVAAAIKPKACAAAKEQRANKSDNKSDSPDKDAQAFLTRFCEGTGK